MRKQEAHPWVRFVVLSLRSKPLTIFLVVRFFLLLKQRARHVGGLRPQILSLRSKLNETRSGAYLGELLNVQKNV